MIVVCRIINNTAFDDMHMVRRIYFPNGLNPKMS